MTVWIWPHEFKHLNERIDSALAASPADLERPGPVLSSLMTSESVAVGLSGNTTFEEARLECLDE